jgi:hypothetical protein
MIIDELFETPQQCPECGGISFSDLILAEKKDACYHKVKASAKVWPSAYASGRLVQCRKKGAANYGNKSEGVAEGVAETLPMDDAVKVLRQYGADHFKTGSETLYFYKNGRPFNLDLIWNNDATRSVSLSQLNSATRELKGQGVAEGSEWETRHDEFTTVGDRATPEQINKIVSALGVAAKQASSKRGFLNKIVGKQSNGDLARMAHSAEILAKNIQRNRNSKLGSDERKELGQHLVYAVSLLKRMNGEQGVMEAKMSAPGTPQWADAVAKAKTVKTTSTLWDTHQNVRNKHMAQLARDSGHTPTPEMIRSEKKGVAEQQELDEKWSQKYKSSINCANPQGFSQRAHCAGRNKNEDVAEGVMYGAENLNVGDDVIVSGDVELNGATGVIDSFGQDKRFVVVDLYNHGRHSFHSSDVSANDYDNDEHDDDMAEATDDKPDMDYDTTIALELDSMLNNGVDYIKAVKLVAKKHNTHPQYVVDAYESWGSFDHDDTFDRIDHDMSEGVAEGEQQKGADYRDPKEVDYDDEYDAMVARVRKLAGLGPMKTVYDPAKRVYRNMPTAQQPKK